MRKYTSLTEPANQPSEKWKCMHVELPIQAKLQEEKKGDTIKPVKHCLGFIPAVVTRSTNQTFLFCPNSTEFGVVGLLVLLVVAVLFSV